MENLPTKLLKLYCYNNQINRLENLPDSLQILDCTGNQFKTLENLPLGLTVLYCDQTEITHIDGVKLVDINFTLNGYQCIRRIQKRINRKTKRKQTVNFLQKELHDWLWKPPFGISVKDSIQQCIELYKENVQNQKL